MLDIKYIKVKVTTNMLLSINGALFSGLDSFPFQIPAAFLDIRYDQAYNMSLDQKLESVQYNASLSIAGAIRGTLKEKL